MKHFTVNELCQSDTATARKISNIPTKEVAANLEKLIDNCLDVIRKAYGKPISVNCGYRSPKLNAEVGGSKTSDHLLGRAADLDNTPGLQECIIGLIIDGKLKFDQFIIEKPGADGRGRWLHVSFRDKNRFQALKFNGKTYAPIHFV